MKSNCTLAEIAEVLRTRRRFVVISHARPDGDALGCTLAMTLCLRQLGKDVTAWNEDGVLEKFRYLPCSELVTKPPTEPQSFDVAIVLDNAVENRAGTARTAIAHADVWINIDHHHTNPRYGDFAYVDASAPAAGQVLYELFRQCDLPLTYEMADNLFAAISTDTGSFQYPSTTARSRDRVASFALSAETARTLGVQPEDNEGLIDAIRSIDTVVAAAFFEELGDGKIRISLRSKSAKIDVSKVCGLFGGGGHKLAAGARTPGTLAEVQEKVLQALDHEFDQP